MLLEGLNFQMWGPFQAERRERKIRTRRCILLHAIELDVAPSSAQVEGPNKGRRRSLSKIDNALPIRYQASATYETEVLTVKSPSQESHS